MPELLTPPLSISNRMGQQRVLLPHPSAQGLGPPSGLTRPLIPSLPCEEVVQEAGSRGLSPTGVHTHSPSCWYTPETQQAHHT